MKVFISGPITGKLCYRKKFKTVEEWLKSQGHIAVNPSFLPDGLGSSDDYMPVCFAMIDMCDAVFFMDGWKDSSGCKKEHEYVIKNNKQPFYEDILKATGVYGWQGEQE